MDFGSRKFTLQLNNFADKVGLSIEDVFTKVGLQAFKRVIEKTPVDTGRAKGNWQISIDAPIMTGVDTVDTTQVGSFSDDRRLEAMSVLAGLREWAEIKIFITNNVVYIYPLEMGHSKQSWGMARTTVQELRSYINAIVNRKD